MKLFKHKKPPSKLMLKVEEMDGKIDTLLDQVSQLAAARPAAPPAEQPAAPGAPDIESFSEFEPFSTTDEVSA